MVLEGIDVPVLVSFVPLQNQSHIRPEGVLNSDDLLSRSYD